MHTVIKIILVIILIVAIYAIYKKYTYKQKGGVYSSLSEYLSKIAIINVSELSDYIYHDYYAKSHESDIDYCFGPDILNNIKSFKKLLEISEDSTLFDSLDVVPVDGRITNNPEADINLKTISGGIAEAITYLTHYNITGVKDFDHNVIAANGINNGTYNVVFNCCIAPCVVENGELKTRYELTNDYALRIKYRYIGNYDRKYLENYANAIQQATEEQRKHFAVSVVPDFTKDLKILSYIDTNKSVVPTRWTLMKDYNSPKTEEFNKGKYLTAMIKCANYLHQCGLLYRDWKLDNFMINETDKDWDYVLTDIDFENNDGMQIDYEDGYFTIDEPIHTVGLSDKNKMLIRKMLINKFGYNSENKHIATDNLILLLSYYIECNKLSYYYFKQDNSSDTLNKFIKLFEDTDADDILVNNFSYNADIFKQQK